MINLNSLLDRKDFLEKEQRYWNSCLEKPMEGNLIARKTSNDNFKYTIAHFDDDGKKVESIIPKTQCEVARSMAFQEYAKAKLSDLKKEIALLNQLIRFMQKEGNASSFLKNHPGHAVLVRESLISEDSFVSEWMRADYQKSHYYPEGLKYPTIIPTLKVRSKAESQIVDLLVQLGIPFRYEELLVINGIALHPDFTCLNVNTHRVYYLEHQGMWDKPEYVSKLTSRAELLQAAGIIPWVNLLITTETYDYPLDINWVELVLRYYLL